MKHAVQLHSRRGLGKRRKDTRSLPGKSFGRAVFRGLSRCGPARRSRYFAVGSCRWGRADRLDHSRAWTLPFGPNRLPLGTTPAYPVRVGPIANGWRLSAYPHDIGAASGISDLSPSCAPAPIPARGGRARGARSGAPDPPRMHLLLLPAGPAEAIETMRLRGPPTRDRRPSARRGSEPRVRMGWPMVPSPSGY